MFYKFGVSYYYNYSVDSISWKCEVLGRAKFTNRLFTGASRKWFAFTNHPHSSGDFTVSPIHMSLIISLETVHVVLQRDKSPP